MYYWIKILWLSIKRLVQDKYTYKAAALAFTTLLALVPLVSVIIFLLTIYPFFKNFTLLAQNYILENFFPTSGNIIEHYLEVFVQQATHLPTLGILFLFFITFTLIISVEHTINEMWKIKKRANRITKLFIHWLVLIMAPVFIGLSVLISSYLFSITWFANITLSLGVNIYLLASIPLIINTFIFSTLYLIVPNAKIKFRYGISGGFIAAILFEISKKIFALYLTHFSTYQLIYGVLATIPIFLIWLYILWLIVLFGALVTHTQYEINA